MPSYNLDITFPKDLIQGIAQRAAQMIRDHARAGIGADGKPLAPYSTKPFARPLGGITERAKKNLGEQLQIFKTREGKLWAVITGGYAAYKKAAYPGDGSSVNLTATGAMIRSITVLDAREDGTFVIGCTRQDEAEKLYYHTVAGAGKSRTIRDVMGFSEKELEELAQMAADGLRFG